MRARALDFLDLLVGEADRCDDLARNHDEGPDRDVEVDVLLEALVDLAGLRDVLLSVQKLTGDVKIGRKLPAVGLVVASLSKLQQGLAGVPEVTALGAEDLQQVSDSLLEELTEGRLGVLQHDGQVERNGHLISAGEVLLLALALPHLDNLCFLEVQGVLLILHGLVLDRVGLLPLENLFAGLAGSLLGGLVLRRSHEAFGRLEVGQGHAVEVQDLRLLKLGRRLLLDLLSHPLFDGEGPVDGLVSRSE